MLASNILPVLEGIFFFVNSKTNYKFKKENFFVLYIKTFVKSTILFDFFLEEWQKNSNFKTFLSLMVLKGFCEKSLKGKLINKEAFCIEGQLKRQFQEIFFFVLMLF